MTPFAPIKQAIGKPPKQIDPVTAVPDLNDVRPFLADPCFVNKNYLKLSSRSKLFVLDRTFDNLPGSYGKESLDSFYVRALWKEVRHALSEIWESHPVERSITAARQNPIRFSKDQAGGLKEHEVNWAKRRKMSRVEQYLMERQAELTAAKQCLVWENFTDLDRNYPFLMDLKALMRELDIFYGTYSPVGISEHQTTDNRPTETVSKINLSSIPEEHDESTEQATAKPDTGKFSDSGIFMEGGSQETSFAYSHSRISFDSIVASPDSFKEEGVDNWTSREEAPYDLEGFVSSPVESANDEICALSMQNNRRTRDPSPEIIDVSSGASTPTSGYPSSSPEKTDSRSVSSDDCQKPSKAVTPNITVDHATSKRGYETKVNHTLGDRPGQSPLSKYIQATSPERWAREHGEIEVHDLTAPTVSDPEDLALSQAQGDFTLDELATYPTEKFPEPGTFIQTTAGSFPCYPQVNTPMDVAYNTYPQHHIPYQQTAPISTPPNTNQVHWRPLTPYQLATPFQHPTMPSQTPQTPSPAPKTSTQSRTTISAKTRNTKSKSPPKPKQTRPRVRNTVKEVFSSPALGSRTPSASPPKQNVWKNITPQAYNYGPFATAAAPLVPVMGSAMPFYGQQYMHAANRGTVSPAQVYGQGQASMPAVQRKSDGVASAVVVNTPTRKRQSDSDLAVNESDGSPTKKARRSGSGAGVEGGMFPF